MKILFITLSNIGDAILTLPVLDSLKEHFPHAQIEVMAGPRVKDIFEKNPYIYKFLPYDKHSRLREKIRLFHQLNKYKFDMVVDLRNSFYGAFLNAPFKTSPFTRIPLNIRHMKDRHLYKIKDLFSRMKAEKIYEVTETTLFVPEEDKEYVRRLLAENNVKEEARIFVVAPGARSHIKQWQKDKFSLLIPQLVKEFDCHVILVGDKADSSIAGAIAKQCPGSVTDLSGKTSIAQLAYLLKMARLLITNDSATLHIASYINMPVVALFGPTNETKYGPWSDNFRIAKKDIFCRPCEKAQCRFRTLECMKLIRPEDVMRQIKGMMRSFEPPGSVPAGKEEFKRILVARTDRIGDVVLSTPVLKALRQEYPHAHIAVMVSAYARDIIEGNPYADEVLVYDKDSRHKGLVASMRFAQELKKKKFDLALILHPVNRVHIMTFFAGIPRRVGYNRKMGFLLTDRVKHVKHLGEKHELDYNLDLLRYLGLEPQDKELFMPLKEESQIWVDDLLLQKGISQKDRLLAIHPGASCPSKIWPKERFAELADKLAEKYGFKVLVVAGPKDAALAEGMTKHMLHKALNLAGKTSVSQLASLLKRCELFISNDSGPVHIASAIGTPVISLFGRAQEGLGPVRWGPTGIKDRIIHKQVGCIECLAHNCAKEFTCLKSISVEDVIRVTDSILAS